jgi:acyl-CoA thioesterase-1
MRVPTVASLSIAAALEASYPAANGAVYLDYFAALKDARGLLTDELTDDGLHPNALGYKAMAPVAEQAIAEALGRKP